MTPATSPAGDDVSPKVEFTNESQYPPVEVARVEIEFSKTDDGLPEFTDKVEDKRELVLLLGTRSMKTEFAAIDGKSVADDDIISLESASFMLSLRW